MLTDDFTHQIGSVFNVQTTALLAKQSAVAASTFTRRTGRLSASLQERATITGTSAQLEYPKYIRFLDMKRGRTGNRKVHAPIYNRPIYGYLVGGVRRFLNAAIPKAMIRAIDESVTSVK